jgi:hypothetical protein
MAAPPLPNQFFVFFQQRKAKTDPYSGLVLLERDLTNPDPVALHLKYPSKSKDVYELKGPLTNTQGSYFGFYTLMGPADTTAPQLQDMARECKGIIIVKKGTTTRIPVFKFHDIAKRFDHILKRNVIIELANPVVAHISPAPSPALVAAPAKKVIPKVSNIKPGDLHPFVAKQLLELAQIKKDMCPITAEEYITGETAAMPCGHLFMKIAITETFKKEPGRCPACRQAGYPTYV